MALPRSNLGPPDSARFDPSLVPDLADELRRTLEGEVRFDRGSRAVYSSDASNYRQVPIGVVVPRSTDDVIATVTACRERAVPVLSRGGGTSLAGQTCNVAVVMDFSKYLNRVVWVDAEHRLARVQPGVVLDTLRAAAAADGLTFGPDPATHDRCTLGGMLGNDSCGVHSVLTEFYGDGPRTANNVEELDVLTYDGLRATVGRTPDHQLDAIVAEGGRRGEIYAGLRALRDRYGDAVRTGYPQLPRRVSGYNLDALLAEKGFDVAEALVGTEGTCVTILGATLKLVDLPVARSVLLLGFQDVFAAADAVPAIRELKPIGLEGFDDVLMDNNRRLGIHALALGALPPGRGWLIVEFGGVSAKESNAKARKLAKQAARFAGFTEARLLDDPAMAKAVWGARESGLGASAFVPGKPDHWTGWEDSAVPPDGLGAYLRELRVLFDRYGYTAPLYGHFGQGCVHCRVSFDLTSRGGLDAWRAFLVEAAELVVSHGGSLSGEHGDGQSHAQLLPIMFGDELVEAMRGFKAIWDPDGKMNPGKVVDPYPLDANMKLGPDYRPPMVETHFDYRREGGSFADATVRCIGLGKCRVTEGQLMCPSYAATRDEEHSTRGRARLLFEMARGGGEAGIEMWRSEEVKRALDLCLSCKGCKTDCPTGVDMATYKAEFLAHHYEGRARPRQAYAMGLIPVWARLASRMPSAANLLTHGPGVSALVKRAGGIAPVRDIPRFAPRTFQEEFFARPPRNLGRPRVLLWPDTFVNAFEPAIGRATVQVLEAAGFRVMVPKPWLCCGRPLYDHGMLGTAKRWLRRTLRELRPQIRAGTPVVGMEPSCVAVFRDELPALFPKDQDARRLSEQTFVLSEFLAREEWSPPRTFDGRPALVQAHCHHRAVMKLDAEEATLDALGLDWRMPEPGCCGMAGSFGFEDGRKFDVSMAIGERALMPAVRGAAPDTLVVADGFSCRQQVEQATGHRPLHLAQLIRLALDGAGRPVR